MFHKKSFAISLKAALIVAFFPYSTFIHAQNVSSNTVEEMPAHSDVQLSPKKPGVVRVGVVLPSNQLAGKGDIQDGGPLRSVELQLLKGPLIEAVPLEAILPDQAIAEAKLRDCDFALESSVSQTTQEKAGRFHKLTGGQMFRLATTAAQFVPVASSTAMAAKLALTSSSQTASFALASSARQVRSEADVTLAFALTDLKSGAVRTVTEKAHSTANGDNVLTGLFTSASTKIVSAVTR